MYPQSMMFHLKIVNLINYVVSVRRGFLFLLVLGMGFIILLWHSLDLPYNYFTAYMYCIELFTKFYRHLPRGWVPATLHNTLAGSPSGMVTLSGGISNFGSSPSAGISSSDSFLRILALVRLSKLLL